MAELSYKFRLYPDAEQQKQIRKTFGCVRYVYNYFLNRRESEYKSTGTTLNYVACARELTALKKTQGYEFLKNADSYALQRSLRALDGAYTNFFKKYAEYPKFKKKRYEASYTTVNNSDGIKVFDNSVKLPKLGIVKCKVHREVAGRILNATISKTKTGKYFVSVNCTDVDIEPLAKTKQSVGIDLGIHSFCTFSDGTKIDGFRPYSESLRKIQTAQKKLSRMKKGSKNYRKQRQKLAGLYERVECQLRDFQHKLSKQIITDFDVICVENLDVSSMISTIIRRCRKYLSASGLSEFKRMLEYKAMWYGKDYIEIDRYFPSSQTCHICGYREPAVKSLRVRQWTCKDCGTNHDRDINAAVNILSEGLKALQ